MGKILAAGNAIVAGSLEDAVAMILAHDAATPLREFKVLVTPICPPARAYTIAIASIPDLEAEEADRRQKEPWKFRSTRPSWDPEL